MILLDALFYFVIIYLIFSIFVFFLVNSNIIPSRLFKQYQIDIPAELRYLQNPKLAYWVAKQTDEEKNVVLLHGFTRNSGRMNKRAKIYWELGYNIYLIDNLGHGRSAFTLFPSGFQYSWEVRRIIAHEKITDPILHGVSMGAIATSYIAQKDPDIPKVIICEALPHNFDNLYDNMMRYMKIPVRLFFWIESVSRAIVWRKFKGKDATYNVKDISSPMLYLHSEEDKMFIPEIHYNGIIKDLQSKEIFETWLVPNASHTRMDQHPEYRDKLVNFLGNFE
ncbi:MAG: alpha/beta hydrolase family protein [Candidatus Kariarchaeaceae archaeon]|jgi:pimeloyl-ACP methyl ester carboxylesterase